MTRNVCLAGLTILILLIKSSGGAILSPSSGLPPCRGSRLQGTDLDKSGILSFRYPGSYFCRWKVEKPKDAGKAVVLRVKKIVFPGCTSKLQLPGMAKICTRTEPFCHVYTSSDSYCTQSDINQQVQASYSDCTTLQIHSGVTTMDLDYSPAGANIKAFQIDFMQITCTEPPTTISSSSATTVEISTTSKAPIGSSIVTTTPVATTTKANLGDDKTTTEPQPPVAVPTTGTECTITSGAKTTKPLPSETPVEASNNMTTGCRGAGFSGIATSTSNIISKTDGQERRKKIRMTEIEEWMEKFLGAVKDDAPEQDDPDKLFLLSLLQEVKSMNRQDKWFFKLAVMKLITEIQYKQP